MRHFGRFMDGVIVHDQVDLQPGWHLFINAAQEGEKLLMTMLPVALADDFAGGDVQGGEK